MAALISAREGEKAGMMLKDDKQDPYYTLQGPAQKAIE